MRILVGTPCAEAASGLLLAHGATGRVDGALRMVGHSVQDAGPSGLPQQLDRYPGPGSYLTATSNAPPAAAQNGPA